MAVAGVVVMPTLLVLAQALVAMVSQQFGFISED
jgi:hypothetical protein